MKIKFGFLPLTLALALASTLATTSSWALGNGEIQPTLALDFVLPVDFKHSEHNKLGLRSAEMILEADLSKDLSAHFNYAMHDHEGDISSEVHEVYLLSSGLLPRTQIKFGKFLLRLGLLNRTHQHDWSFTFTPQVQSLFFASEGVSDTGLEVTHTLPTDLSWDITLGLTNGYSFGHTHEHDPAHSHGSEKPKVPTHYFRAANYLDIAENAILEYGINYLGRTDAEELNTQLYGFDFLIKSDRSEKSFFSLSSEVWFRDARGGEHIEDTGQDLGFYIFPEFRTASSQKWGLRYDYLDAEQVQYSLAPTWTYELTETSWLRLSYSWANLNDEQVFGLQWVAIIGSHHSH